MQCSLHNVTHLRDHIQQFLQISLCAGTHEGILLVTGALLCSVYSDTTDQMVRTQNLQSNYLLYLDIICILLFIICNVFPMQYKQ